MCLRKEKEKGSILGETDQGFGEADLPEHLIARNRPFPRCVEENVSNGTAGLECRVVDG